MIRVNETASLIVDKLRMKDKNLAAVLAFFGGYFGLHRFYLGQIGLGVMYCVFFPIAIFIGIIDAVVLLGMDQDTFDRKYNDEATYRPTRTGVPTQNRYERYRQREAERRGQGVRRKSARGVNQDRPRATNRKVAQSSPGSSSGSRRNQDREAGLQYFKDYDYERAIESFEASLRREPKDIATHWNLACCYSLTEDTDKAIYHLDRAVAMGFDDFERIREHDGLAYLRIQPAFTRFQANNYRMTPPVSPSPFPEKATEGDLLSQPLPTEPIVRTNNDLLDQLQRLGQLREKGLLTEAEFAAQKRKLLG